MKTSLKVYVNRNAIATSDKRLTWMTGRSTLNLEVNETFLSMEPHDVDLPR